MRSQCTRVCSVEGCAKPVAGRGVCSAHYYHLRKTTQAARCAVESCTEPVRSRGWCNTHYVQFQRTGDPLGSRPRRQRKGCTVEGCSGLAVGRGYCHLHWTRWRSNGDPLIVHTNAERRTRYTCIQCGSSFFAKPHKHRKFCGLSCAMKARRAAQPSAARDVPCAQCGKTFRLYAKQQFRFCSIACRKASYPETCTVDGCVRRCVAKGKCRVHDPKSREAAYRSEHKRRARLLDAFVAPVSRDDIYARDRGTCQLCFQPVSRKSMTIDHIVPLALGGTHEPKNVRLAHKGCNSKRGIRYEGQLPLPLQAREKPRPSGHPRSKLSDEQAIEAWTLRRDGWKVPAIAERFGVSTQVIYALCWGTRRRHLNLPPLR